MSRTKIAYLVNQYPKVSHSFIRREILALEEHSIDVFRISIRGWGEKLVDVLDIKERDKTFYILKKGLCGLLMPALQVLITSPWRFCKSLLLAIECSRRADRSFPYHLIYLAEACVLFLYLKRVGAQHLHVHFGTNGTEVALLAKSLGGPDYSFTVHGPEEFDKPEFIKLSQKIEHATFVVAISSYCRSQLFRWIKYTQWSKVKEIHCGLEDAFHMVDSFSITNLPRIVCIGRLSEQKGQLLLLDAVNSLNLKGIPVELVLGGDGEMRAELESLIEKYGLVDKVRITGWISSEEVRKEIISAKALVLPSFAEGLPVVIMEAMALRRPVLSTYIAAIPELVIDGETGFLFPAGDVSALANAIEKVLLSPIKDLERIGERAYKRVLERHSIDNEASKLASLFKHAITMKTGV